MAVLCTRQRCSRVDPNPYGSAFLQTERTVAKGELGIDLQASLLQVHQYRFPGLPGFAKPIGERHPFRQRQTLLYG